MVHLILIVMVPMLLSLFPFSEFSMPQTISMPTNNTKLYFELSFSPALSFKKKREREYI